jgi:hypothetical protein
LNSGLRAVAAFWAGLLGLFTLVLLMAGCSDHGPANLFSPELFNKNIAAPNLTFGSASAISFTTFAPDAATHNTGPTSCGQLLNCFSQNGSWLSVALTVVNTGGAGTYAPVLATFSSSDPRMMFLINNPSNSRFATAISPDGAGNEILPNAQTAVTLEQGWTVNGSLYYNNTGLTLQFYYADNTLSDYSCPGGVCNEVTVPVTMSLQDGLGVTYTDTIYFYISEQ